MIRSTLIAGLSAGLLWAVPTKAQEPKKADPTPAPAAKADPAPTPPPMGGISPQTQKINELIAKGWESVGIKKPAEKATDHEFLRRVFIDLQGRIPTPEEIYDYEQDRGQNKRVRLVHRLLYAKHFVKGPSGKALTEIPGIRVGKEGIDYSSQYANNFAELWAVWLLTRSGIDDLYREQFMMWLEENLDKNLSYREFVTELISATGKSNGDPTKEKVSGAVHFVFRHLGDPLNIDNKGAKIDTGRDGKYDNVPITSRVTRMFLGIQTQCTQCHDHPQAKEWKQRDFWGVNAFFRQTEKRGQQTAMMAKKGAPLANYVELTDMPEWNKEFSVFYDQRDGQRKAMYATMLKDVAQAEADQRSTKTLATASNTTGKTRRQMLAEWVLQHDNFEKAYVNRMWGHLFGRGLHKEPTVDDFKSDNEIVHPELLQYLAEQFKAYNYDSKRLLEWICTSDAYQLSHVAGKEKVGKKSLTDVEFDPYFARMPLKALSPEVLFESLSIATRARARLGDEAFKTLKRDWSKKLVSNFGDDEGNEANFNGTIVQALLMMNGKELNGQLKSDKGGKGGVLADVIAKRGTPSGVCDELFLMTVSRHPTSAELAKLEEIRMGKAKIVLGAPAPGSKGPAPSVAVPGAAGAGDVSFYEDVLWALLNTNEFVLNH